MRRPPRFLPAWGAPSGFNPDAPDFDLPLADLGAGAVNTPPTAGSGVATFTRTTAAGTILSTGLLADVATGVARSRYTPAASPVYQGYFAEGAGTNLCLQSEDFGTTWAAIGTPTRSAAAKTCGVVNLDLIGDDDVTAVEGYSQTVAFTGNAVKAISFFFSQGSSVATTVRLRDTTAPADRLLGVITWSAGVPTLTMTTGTLLQISGPYGSSGVYRAEVLTTSVTATNTNSLQFYPATDAALAVLATGDVYVGGVQAENSALLASSYIKTTTGAVTRNADSLTYDQALSAIAGAAYGEVSVTSPATGLNNHFLDGGSTGAGLLLSKTAADALTTISMDDGAADELTKAGLTSLLDVPRKRASAWSGNVMSITGDGAAVATGAFDGAMTATSFRVCTAVGTPASCILRAKAWRNAPTDAQLEALTA